MNTGRGLGLALLAVVLSLAPLRSLTGQAIDVAPLMRRTVTINLGRVTLDRALHEVARSAGIGIIYSSDAVPVRRVVSLDCEDELVLNVLERLLAGTGVRPHVTAAGHVILVSDQPSPDAGQASLRGVVRDGTTGLPIAGAAVVISGGLGAFTDTAGQFQFPNLKRRTYRLRAWSTGYAERAFDTRVWTDETELEVDLEPRPVAFDELVVAGTMAPTPRRVLANPITLIRSEDIEKRAPSDVAELMRGEVPGVIAPDNGQSAENYGAGRGIYVRGGATLGNSLSNALKVYLDGIELANYRQVHTIDPAAIDRIEILRGPQASTIHGSGALSGVMRIYTRNSASRHGRAVDATFGVGVVETETEHSSAPVLMQSASLAGRHASVSYNVTGSYRFTGDWTPDFYIDNRSLTTGARYQSNRLAVSATARVNQRTSRTGINPTVRERIATGQYRYTPAGVAPYHSVFELDGVTYGGTVEYWASPNWRHTITLGQDQSEVNAGRPRPTLYWPEDTLTGHYTSSISRKSFAYHASWTHEMRNTTLVLTTGADSWQWREERSTESRARTEENFGAFGQLQLETPLGVAVTAALRADHNENFGDRIERSYAPRIGIAWLQQFDELTVKLRSSHGMATRPPTGGQKSYAVVTPSQTHLNNDRLRPEHQRGTDVGVDLAVGGSLALEVTYYDQRVRDLIAEAYWESNDPVWHRYRQHQNMGDVHNRGWEMQAATIFGAISLAATWTIIDSRVLHVDSAYRGALRPGERLHGIARHAGAASMMWRGARSTGSARVNYIGTSRQLDRLSYEEARRDRLASGDVNEADFLTDYYPAVWRVGLNATRDLNTNLTLFLDIDNALDAHTTDTDNSQPVRGRRTMIDLRARF